MKNNLIYFRGRLNNEISRSLSQVIDIWLGYGIRNGDVLERVHVSNTTVASMAKVSTRTVLRMKNEAEDLGIMERYYDPIAQKECLRVYIRTLANFLDKKGIKYLSKIFPTDLEIPILPSNDLVNESTTPCRNLVNESTTPCRTISLKQKQFNNTSTVIFDKSLEEQLTELSDKKAHTKTLDDLLVKYRTPLKHVINAIDICNQLTLIPDEYNKYLSLASYKLYKENLSETEIKEIICKRLTKQAKKTEQPTANAWQVDDLIAFGLNYNNNFNEPYAISKQYAFAAEALRNAGVSFEIR